MFVAGATTSTREQKSFEGGLQRLELKKVTGEPCASFLLVMTFSYTLHDGTLNFFCGEFLLVLVYEGSTSCMPRCWFIWGVSLTCPVLDYMWSFSYSYTPHAGFFLWGVSLIRSICWLLYLGNFFFTKQETKNVKVNKNVHN